MGLTGIIIVNPFGVPGQSVIQAQRLETEFKMRGVKTEIVSCGYLKTRLAENALKQDFGAVSFAVYLDKDKYLSSILEKTGVRLFNGHEQIRICDDKGETYIALSGKGFNLPDTVFAPLCYSDAAAVRREAAESIGAILGYPIVVKESFGSMGKGVHLAENENELYSLMQKLKTVPHLFQRYIGARFGTDVRVIVVGGKAAAAMLRQNEGDFRSNIALGGRGEKIDLNSSEYAEFICTAERAAKTLSLDYCGVDLLFGNNGEPVVCEVNSNAFFAEIEKVTGVNVAGLYAEYVLSAVKN